MKKKFIAAVAAVLSTTLLFGTVAFAASSPTTSSSSSTTTTTETTVSTSEQYIVDSVAALSGDGTEAVVGTILVSADYTGAYSSDYTLVVSTSYLGEDSILKQLLDQMNAILPAGYAVSEDDVFDVTLRDAENEIFVGDNGLYAFSFGVGNEYDGMILTVYVYDGTTLVPYQGTVSKGKLVISDVVVSDLLRFYIAKPPVGTVAE